MLFVRLGEVRKKNDDSVNFCHKFKKKALRFVMIFFRIKKKLLFVFYIFFSDKLSCFFFKAVFLTKTYLNIKKNIPQGAKRPRIIFFYYKNRFRLKKQP